MIPAAFLHGDRASLSSQELVPLGAGASAIAVPVPLSEPEPAIIRSEWERTPSWLCLLDRWYSAARRVGPVAVDAALCLITTYVLVASIPDSAIAVSLRQAAVAGVAFVAAGLVAGLWKPRSTLQAQGLVWAIRPTLLASAGASAALLSTGTPSGRAAVAGLALLLGLLLGREVAWLVLAAARRRGLALHRSVLIASDDWAAQLRRRMLTFPEAGLYCASTMGPPSSETAVGELTTLLDRAEPDHVIVAGCPGYVLRTLTELASERLECSVVLPVKGTRAPAHIGDIGLIPMRLRPPRASLAAKRAMDLLVSLVVLVVASPVFLGIAAAIRLHDGGPIFFRQRRVGRLGHKFSCLKFRSMVLDAETQKQDLLEENLNTGLLFKMADDPRITRVGRLLRRTSIDELPQLFNVLRGEMSLVGPRPLPVEPEDFEPDARFRHSVPPGITGLWQVHGSNAIDYPDMLDLDHTYVTTRTLAMDLAIIASTLPALLVRRSAC